MSVGDWVPWVAVAAFGLSIVNTVWNIRRDMRDKGAMRVVAALYHVVTPDNPREEEFEREWLVVTATNVGTRPVTVKGFYGVINAKKHFLLMPSNETCEERMSTPMPQELCEGQSARCIVPPTVVEKENVKYFFVTDTHDRDWKSRQNPLRAAKNKQTPRMNIE
ncbi:MAG: hypothetical protein KAY37_01635 [Phycisphaerae bacterium]|nr:hypothetical protein [Phycisphaerae bacterium]